MVSNCSFISCFSIFVISLCLTSREILSFWEWAFVFSSKRLVGIAVPTVKSYLFVKLMATVLGLAQEWN